jgi:alpha-glucosidase
MNKNLRLLLIVFTACLALSYSIHTASAASNDNNVEWNGLFSDQGPLYFSPSEPATTDAVTVKLRVFKGDISSANVKYYDSADSQYHWLTMVWSNNDVTGTFDIWKATVPASSSLKWYRFQINDGSSTAWLNAGGISASEPTSGDFWIVPGFHTPNWSKDAIYYQVFPDRFSNGNTSNDLTYQASGHVAPTNGACPSGSYLYGNSCAYEHTAWSQLPENPPYGDDFFGGDLAGITAQINPYLKGNLGVTALYLNPIFTSPSNHKYDTQDYMTVDPHFGTNTDLQTLISTAHGGSYRMSVLLDGVFNHTSDFHQWFDDQHLYSTNGAYESQSSQWSDRYTFLTWPTIYCNWSGYNSLVKLNYSSSSLRDDIYRSSGSVMQTYLKAPYSADGWRYDVADNIVSITNTSGGAGSCTGTDDHQIWQDIRPYVKGISSEALMLGEYWQNANAWLNGKEWDSVMNYNGFNIPVSEWIDCQNVHGENPGQCLTVTQLDNWLRGTLSDNPHSAQLSMMNSLTTHDTSRFLYRAGGDTWKMKLAIILQMTYVGAPSIYYGDEIGMTGGNDPDNRRTFDWNTGDWNTTLQSLYKTLISARKNYSAFRDGSFKTLLVDDTNKLYSYGRWDANNWAIVVTNNDSNGHNATISAYQLSIPNGKVLTDVLTGTTYTVSNGQITVPSSALLGHYGVVLVASTGGTRPSISQQAKPTPTFVPPSQ